MPKYYTYAVPDWVLLLEKIQNELNTFEFTVEEILDEGLDGRHSVGLDALDRKTLKRVEYFERSGTCLTEKFRRQRVRQSLTLMAAKGYVVVPEKGSEAYSLTDRGRAVDVMRLQRAA